LNAAGEFVTMLFIDDTVGWVVVGTNGVVA